MEIDINSHRMIRLEKIYNEIEIVSGSGDSLILVERNGRFEFRLDDIWYVFDGKEIKRCTF